MKPLQKTSRDEGYVITVSYVTVQRFASYLYCTKLSELSCAVILLPRVGLSALGWVKGRMRGANIGACVKEASSHLPILEGIEWKW